VVFDGVETTTAALSEAIDLADRRAVIDLIGIVSPRWLLHNLAFASGSGLPPERLREEELHQLRGQLLEAGQAVPGSIGLRTVARVGRRREVLTELVRSAEFDLIIVPRRTGFPRVLPRGRRSATSSAPA
jgi:hypothetical protein